MLKKSCSLLFHQLRHHITKNGSNGIETLVCCAYIIQSMVIQKNFLHDKDGHCFAKLGARLHYSQAQWDNFGCKEEIDHVGRIVFDKSPNDTKRCQSEIFERP